jgi:hypothetical protein
MKATILIGVIMAVFSTIVSATGAVFIEFYSDVNCGDKIYTFISDSISRGKPQTLVDFTAYSIKTLWVDEAYSGAEILFYRHTNELSAGDEAYIPNSSDEGYCFSNNHEGWVHYVTQPSSGLKRDTEPEIQNNTLSRRNWPAGWRHDWDVRSYVSRQPYLSLVAGKPALTLGILRTIVNAVVTSGITTPTGVLTLPGGWVLRWTSASGGQVPTMVIAGWLANLRNDYVTSWQDTMASTTILLTDWPDSEGFQSLCKVTFGVE